MQDTIRNLSWSLGLVGAVMLTPLSGFSASAAVDVDALLGRMSLDEKIGQMVQVDSNALKDREGDVATYFVGSVLSGGGSDPASNTLEGWTAIAARMQGEARKTRLQIPLIYGVDAVHGHNNVLGAVIMPHNIGLGATRNPDLVEQAGRVTAREVAATGIGWTFAPCIAVTRNERWGRSYESFGEDPGLVGSLGAAAVKGLQGADLSAPDGVLACAKHYVGDGGTVDGKDQGDVICSEDELRRIHLAPYQDAVKAGTGSIMVSFTSWNGTKMHGQRHLITEVLKGELGFEGFLCSDWAAIDQLPGDYRSDVEISVNAGLDMFMIPNGPGQENSYVDFIRLLKEHVAEGRVPMARIDDAVRRILQTKAQLGLFEGPKGSPALVQAFGSAEHREIARRCVQQSLVVLQNTGRTLPLSTRLKRVHVAGKADDLGVQCGGWTIDWQGKKGALTPGGTTILEGVRQTVGSDTKVTYSADGSGVAGADVALVVVGEDPYAEMFGDRETLELGDPEEALIQTCRDADVPVVLVILSGRPLLIEKILPRCQAVVAAWLPGTEGRGVADVLFGAVPATGKLPVSWPRNMGQVPLNVGDKDADPLFPYGFGLRL